MKKTDQLVTTCKAGQVLAGFLKKGQHLPHWESHRDGQSEILADDYYDDVILSRMPPYGRNNPAQAGKRASPAFPSAFAAEKKI